ncbi:Aspartate aminotransferase, cytoplasmic [Komagataella kurtzmanii]|nr:Aspartate aminotransferase, cytoplasmic [Komagataella kurtzmanii]
MSFSTQNIPQLPPDPLFGLKARYTADSRSDKVDLGIGAYRDNDGKPWVLPAVSRAETLLKEDPLYNHEYLPISGFAEFTSAAAKVILGDDSPALKENRVVSIQSLSGTGALHVVGAFVKKFYKVNSTDKEPVIYLSDPTWANHVQIFDTLGLQIAKYPYWNDATKSLDLAGFLDAIKSAPKHSVFLLHACAHNPTGLDPTQDEWKQILDALAQYQHLPLFDSAYQGFASGSLDKDNWAVRTAIAHEGKFPIIICQSFAKNCGMYGERVGAVHLVLPEKDEKLSKAVSSQLQKIIRSEISNPPAYGAKVVGKILNSPDLRKQWEADLITMSTRIHKMRVALRDELVRLGTPGNWDHIVNQQGMFSFTGLKKEQVAKLESDHGIYLVGSGRASIAGLNENNVKRVAAAIDQVVRV